MTSPGPFRMDVARWPIPGGIGDPAEITMRRTLMLLYRHMGLRAVAALRIAQWLKARGVRGGPSFMQRLIFRRYGLDIVVRAPIGGGLYIAHPVGTTLAPDSIGENCSVIAAVTVGMRNQHEFPTIGDRVVLGAGARVLGAVVVGDDAKVGANAVVIHDVDPATTVGGIPAAPITPSRRSPDTAGDEP